MTQWNTEINYFEMVQCGRLPSGFDQWGLLYNEDGITIAHLAAMQGKLPSDFDQWGLTDNVGWSVAHVAAFNNGLTVREVYVRRINYLDKREKGKMINNKLVISELANCTEHEVVVYEEEGMGVLMMLKPSGVLARVSEKKWDNGVILVGGVEIPRIGVGYGEVEGLPERKEGTLYIVSALVKQRVPEREDVVVPSNPVRDSKGKIIGCRAFA
jgi:hypothetical protein